MSQERFMITGALGSIGAWVVRTLIQEGIPTVVFDLGNNPHRLRLVMSEEELAMVRFLQGDITDLAAFEGALQDSAATHIIHLAALQVPFCAADPVLGARVNVVGTVNVFEAAKKAGLRRVVYASSVAVFGKDEEYESPPADDAPLAPRTHYGVYKQANEGTARIYWQDHAISSIGLRPYIVYGPGRDQGMTSGPTKAMLAAAAGQAYHIGFGGSAVYHYAADVARGFILAARADSSGAQVFNVPGLTLSVPEFITAIEAAAPEARGKITFDDKPLPLPASVDTERFHAAVGALAQTPLSAAVPASISLFRQAIAAGKISFS